MNRFALLINLIFCSLCCIAQQPAFNHFGIEEGLLSNKVYFVFQDHQGFMWMSTDRGVSRFNGKTFSNFTVEDGLGDNEVFTMELDSDQRIWMMTNNGNFSFFKNGSFQTLAKEDSNPLGKTILYDFLEVAKDSFLLASGQGLFKINLDNKKSKKILFEKKERIFFIWEKRKNEQYALTSKGIFRLRNQTDFEPLHLFESHLNFSKATTDEFGNILFLGKEGLFFFNPDEGIKKLYASGTNEIISIKIIDHQVWLGKRKGVFRFDFNEEKLILKDSFLLDKSITSVEKDFEGGFWFSSLRSGVFYAAKINVRIFSNWENCKKCHLSFVKNSPNGDLWVGGHEGFLMKKNKDGSFFQTINHPKNPKLKLEINNIFFKNDEIFLTSNGPSILLQPDVNLFHRPAAARDVLFDDSGNIWMASSNGVIRFPWKKFRENFNPKSDSAQDEFKKYLIFNQQANSLFKDKEGKIWIGTNQGLYYFKDENFHLFKNNLLSSKVKVTDILEVENQLLITTAGKGLFSFGEENFHFQKKNGLASNYCNNIFTDTNNQVYIGTSNGISVLFFEGQQLNVQPFIDLGITEINDISIQRSPKNNEEKILAATSNGLAIFDKKLLSPNPTPPFLFLENITINDSQNISLKKLSHDRNNIQFSFTGVSFANAKNLEYQYFIKGLKSSWKPSTTPILELVSIPPGEYVLQAKVCLKNSSTCSKIIEIPFQISPPFWATWWFRGLVLITLGGLIYSFFKIRILTYNRDVVRELIQLIINQLKREVFVTIKDIRDGSQTKISIQKIKWIESNRNYLTFHLEEKEVIARIPMKNIEEKLKSQKYNSCFRVHRSYIVNKKHIEAWHSSFVKIGDKKIPIGLNYKKSFFENQGSKKISKISHF